jgi:hypothetical protein
MLSVIKKVPGVAWVPVAIVYVTGLAVLGYAGYRTIQRMKYGTPVLVFKELPLMPGRALQGLVVVKRGVIEQNDLDITLECSKPNPAILINNQPVMEPIFTASVRAARQTAQSQALGTVIPVQIDMPADQPAYDDETELPVKWTLTVRTNGPGVDMKAEFDLPVFHADPSRIEERPPDLGLP